jgi:hypothetical protein
MVKCPNCGSTAQPELQNLYFHDGNRQVERIKVYSCGCRCLFKVTETFSKKPGDTKIETMFFQESAKTIRSEMTKKMNYRRKNS